jgi:predicted CoA-binding protein
MLTLKQINEFLNQRKYAIVGVSANKNKFGNTLYKEAIAKNMDIIPIHPHLDSIEGKKCYSKLSDLEGIEAIIISVSPKNTVSIVNQAIDYGIKHIWLQQGAETKEAIDLCEKNNINVIYQRCLLMFINGDTMPHKIHRFFSKLFGKYPK